MQSLLLPALFWRLFWPCSLSVPSSWFQSLPIKLSHTHTHTPPNGVCQWAQSWLSTHSELRINAMVLLNASKVIWNVCAQVYSLAFQHVELESKAFIKRFLPPSSEFEQTQTHIHLWYNGVIITVTYTGSKAPRLPLEKLCCSHIVYKEKQRRVSDSVFIPVGRHKYKHQIVFILPHNRLWNVQ